MKKTQNNIKVLQCPMLPLDNPHSGYPGFFPHTEILPKGYRFQPDRLPLPCDTLCEQDAAIMVRDGTTLYADIYRPVGDEKVPVILCWGSWGKRGKGLVFPDVDRMPNYIPNTEKAKQDPLHPRTEMYRRSELSGLQAWGGEDPAQWVPYGYAVVNVDPRGVYWSEGDMHYFDTQNGRDAYDVIEWLAEQPWCNGRIGTSGNHWYGIEQWFIAQECPPHLFAIHPAEAHGDFYRDEIVRGGIPRLDFGSRTMSYGKGKIEDIVGMSLLHPTIDAYWKEKEIQFEKIKCPVFLTCSFTQWNHSRGPFDGFNRLGTEEKWMRIHNGMEFIDFRLESTIAEVRKFFDHYLKGMDNGWEETPRVRLSVLDPGGFDIVERPEAEFPLARQETLTLYLDIPSGMLTEDEPTDEATVSYISDDHKGCVRFRHRFTEETEITGFSKLHVIVSTDKAIDMDVFVRIHKLDPEGNRLYANYTNVYAGPNGRLRASLRRVDAAKSSELIPYHPYDRIELVEPFAPVELDIGIWPTSLRFHPGEQLELEISGFELQTAHLGDAMIETVNRGAHTIYSGGRHCSYLQIPVIPISSAT